MAGLLTHVIVSFFGGGILFYFFRNWIYGVGFALGQFMPDLIDFGITGIKIFSFNPTIIVRDVWFYPLKVFGHSPFNWAIIFAGAFFLSFIIFRKKEFRFKIYNTLIFFLAGVFVHLALDKLILEVNHWI